MLRPFHMELWWLKNSTFNSILQSAWLHPPNSSLAGARWSSQWRLLQKFISQWATLQRRADSLNRRTLESQIETLYSKAESSSLDDHELLMLRSLKLELDSALEIEDAIWRQRAKTRWIKDEVLT
ncbi:hypothetical protein Cni_G25634 [Canna indica]|uniref:Uncharacterized protein n=1 Tax=Canna indica TaxID=4628 RepID=A0AAQ3QPL0_9LILI|nr:hypothetical protein Cni_G25634 [Canna indica]